MVVYFDNTTPHSISCFFLQIPQTPSHIFNRMGDHLALLVDHLLTESTLEAAIASRKQGETATNSTYFEGAGKEFTRKRNIGDTMSLRKLVECRICQEEDEDCNMEIPCSCCGSLKYAHRKCVQRWCNEKGDTVCEICLQQFKPGYTALLRYGNIPMNFRANWEIAGEDLSDSEIITLFPSEQEYMNPRYHDISAFGERNTVCCQSIALVFTALLLLRHMLPLMLSGDEQHTFTPSFMLVLKISGILLPVLLIVRTITTYHQYHRQQRNHQLPRPAEG
ncbi:hypothetical protein Cni_G09902 [Canna indica]|uniref:RING-CH-type domain-containing protein n=1 Tax=Canna indica TaxID=4628 RepID=A0AAQ3K3C7_9LILI|nr:hypothetical protein Cni_G09902 [Canna indica]